MALPMNVSGLRRNIKNIAHNYTDAQVKVREATSNDPWGPSSTIMSEIADLTYNVVAFSEIMQMVWKRLNDHGKNWRHVYKALVLLEYLIKTGSEKVADQSRENIHSISTLKDFQYIEEGKDQGINVREKAKAMVSLLKDDERLRSERVRALKAKERFAQSMSGIASDADINSPTSATIHDTYVSSSSRSDREAYGVAERVNDYGELESARPHTVGEEELQLQLALAMSKEEADNEEAKRRSDDVRLQMALTESKDETGDEPIDLSRQQPPKDRSGMNDLLDINFNPPTQNGGRSAESDLAGLGAIGGLSSISPPLGATAAPSDPWGLSPPVQSQPQDPWGVTPAVAEPVVQVDPWSAPAPAPVAPLAMSGGAVGADPWSPPPKTQAPPVSADPWSPPAAAPAPVAEDPWAPVKAPSPAMANDPFAPIETKQPSPEDDFAVLSTREKPADGAFSLAGLDGSLPPLQPSGADAHRASPAKSRSPASFLGENSNLVNLDNLVSASSKPNAMGTVLTGTNLSTSSPNLNAILSNNNKNIISNAPTITNANSATNLPSNTANPFAPSPTPAFAALHAGANPFRGGDIFSGGAASGVAVPNPFQAAQAPKPSINELRSVNTPPNVGNVWGETNGSNNINNAWGDNNLQYGNNLNSDPFML